MMKTAVAWKQNLAFNGRVNEQTVSIDSGPPLGQGAGFTPKELLGVAVSACTAMDVAALLKKYQQNVTGLRVEAEIQSTSRHPIVFESVELTYFIEGEIQAERALEAVHLSQSKYCGVSAMVAQTAIVTYKVLLNGQPIGTGQSQFENLLK